MAQKKLLSLLMVGLVNLATITLAEPRVQVSDEDQIWVKDLAQNARRMVMSEIKQKYIELQKMLSKENRDSAFEEVSEELVSTRPVLRVFVSSSMNSSLLKNYVEEARHYDAVLIFKGLPGGSWRKLSQLVTEITGDNDEGVAIQIDDEAFDHFGITSVPSFVLSQEDERWMDENAGAEVSDKVIGNIGIRGALKLIAAEGDLADLASQILERAGGIR